LLLISFRKFFSNQAILVTAILTVISIQYIGAQETEKDTVDIIQRIVHERDTLIRSGIRDTTNRWSDRFDAPIDSVLFRNNNSRFKKELYNLIIKGQPNTRKKPATNTNLLAMDGMVIRNIDFHHVDIFAPSVFDSNYVPDSWFEKTVNITHNDTREAILKRNLLIKKGERLDVYLAAENERIIRDLSYISDARFVAMPVEGTDSVDLLLMVQDKMPIGVEGEIQKGGIAALGISHQNMLGIGHQLSITSYWDSKNVPHFGYRVTYGTPNLLNSFTSARITYIDRWNQNSVLIDINRNFRAMSIRNAGGITFERTNAIRNVALLDTTYINLRDEFSDFDIWAGRILLPLRYRTKEMRSGLFISGRLNIYNNYVRPVLDENFNYPYQDKTLLLFNTGISRQGFRKDNMIYTFGRTEDVPYGYLFEITSGAEWSNEKVRPYISFGAAYGKFFKKQSYLYTQLRFGTFLNRGEAEQSAFKLQMQYFSLLRKSNRFQFRNFFNLTYLNGINRYPGEFITLANRGGIEGLSGDQMKGHDKIVFNFESVVFSPYVLLGFRFAFFGGADIGFIRRDDSKILDSRIFTGLNVGVRIRNEQLVFDTFVLKFSLYPGRPDDGSAQYLILDYVPRLRFNDFFPDKPGIVNYQ
jgi:hypothetical protein